VKDKSKQLLDNYKRLIVSKSMPELDAALVKCTWNDFECPKAKHLETLNSFVARAVASHSITTEHLLQTFEQRLAQQKWKMVFKTLLVVSELTAPQKWGDQLMGVFWNRPQMFNFTFSTVKTTALSHKRKTVVNHLLAYLSAKLANFSRDGRCIENAVDTRAWLQKRFLPERLVEVARYKLDQLDLALQTEFPPEDRMLSFVEFQKELLFEEVERVIGGLFQVFVELLETKQRSELAQQEAERLLKSTEEAKNFVQREFTEEVRTAKLESVEERRKIATEIVSAFREPEVKQDVSPAKQEPKIDDIDDIFRGIGF